MQYQKKKKKPYYKVGRRTEQTFFFPKGKNADGQQLHENMLNTTNYQGNANQNHNELKLHTCQMAIIKKNTNGNCW